MLGNELPTYATLFPGTAKTSIAPRWNPKSGMTVTDSKFGAVLDFPNAGYKQIFEKPMSFSYNYSPKTRKVFKIYRAHGTCNAWNRRKCKTNTLVSQQPHFIIIIIIIIIIIPT
jgi:hypothetical protein